MAGPIIEFGSNGAFGYWYFGFALDKTAYGWVALMGLLSTRQSTMIDYTLIHDHIRPTK